MADAPDQPKRRGRPPKKPKLDTDTSSEEGTPGPTAHLAADAPSSSQPKSIRSSSVLVAGTSPGPAVRGYSIGSNVLQPGVIPRVAQPRTAVHKGSPHRPGLGLRSPISRPLGNESSAEGRPSGQLGLGMAGSGDLPRDRVTIGNPVREEPSLGKAGSDVQAPESSGAANVMGVSEGGAVGPAEEEPGSANGDDEMSGKGLAEGTDEEHDEGDAEMEDGEDSYGEADEDAFSQENSKAAEALISVSREASHGLGNLGSRGGRRVSETGVTRPGEELEELEGEDAVDTVAAALAEGVAEGATAGVAEAVAKAADSETRGGKEEEGSEELRMEGEGAQGGAVGDEPGGRGTTMTPPRRRGRPAKRGRAGGGRWAGPGRGRGSSSPGRGSGGTGGGLPAAPREGTAVGVGTLERPLGKRRGRPPRQRSPPPADGPLVDDLARQLAVAEEGAEDDRASAMMDAVVKVFCVHTEPNFSLPWQKKRQYSSNSSGFIISGRRVLTNAHSVEHYTMVKVKKRGSDTKFLATVLAVGTECDIALLSVEDEAFWEEVEPLELGPLPRLQDGVTVAGYPIGGDTISVTSGVVSRIEVTSYVHGACELLGVQIDAAINAGNSGGPAFNNYSQCVGIAFQSLKNEDTENIGYIIPTPVIHHFIQDYERTGGYTGFPTLGWDWQKMESPDLRRALGMGPQLKGVRVRRIEPTAPAAQVLKPSDVVLSFDGMEIANDGTVPFRQGERIGFSYLVSQKYTGERARLSVLRSGQRREVTVQLQTHRKLIPVHIQGRLPSYYIVAGVLFTAVTVPYLRSEYGKDYDYEAPVKLLEKLMHAVAEDPEEEVVVVSQVLVADVNIGYEEFMNTQVVAFNGTPVKNLKQLAKLVEGCQEPFMRFDLDYQQIMVLDTQAAKKSTVEILATHCIPSAMSSDLLA